MTKVLKLESKGFKSFADKTEIVFGDTFNVVIGPNGSGKSNVFDALSFVLGKSGAKGLRAEKSANLIYNGGKSKQAAKQGEVSIYLDNADGAFQLKTKVVKITRIIKPTGTSIYKINDEKHTRDQLVELLGNAYIDPNGYNIILQGDIVRLVEMSTIERRGIIEEIAGISIYEDKKTKAMRELSKIEANVNEAEIILSERKIYLKELKKERDQAITFKELQDRSKSVKATIVHLDVSAKQKQIDDLKKSTTVYTDKIALVQKEIEDLKKIVSSNKEAISAINKEIEEKGEKNQVALHKEVEQIKVALATKTATIEAHKKDIARVEEQKAQYASTLKEVRSKVGLITKEIETLQKNLADNTKMQKDVSDKISAFKKKNNMDDASEVDVQIAKLDEETELLEKEMFEYRVKQQDMIREKDRLEVQIANADERIEKVLSISKEHKADLDALKEMKQQFKVASVDLQKCLTKDQSFVAQISTARGKLQRAQEELAKLQVRQASLNERLGANQGIKAILDNRNQFGGVYGTVAELGTVDTKYSIALDVAAGGRLNSIVVKDDAVAAKCIKFLRSQKLGVATFLPLNKIKGTDAKKVSAAGVVGTAIELVRFDPKYTSVFKYVFGSTIVVENIDVARRIGVGTIKMVTLEGDVAEASGAMQGGFAHRRSGSGFQEAKVSENADKCEAEVSDYQSLLMRLEKERSENSSLIDALRERKASLEGNIIKTEKSLHLDSDDLDMSKKLKSDFGVNLKKVSDDLDAISMTVSTKNRALAMLKVEKQKLRAQILDIRNPTKIAELNMLTEKLHSLRTTAIRYESEIKAKQSSNEHAGEQQQLSELIAKYDAEIESIRKDSASLKETIVVMTASLKEKEAAEKEFYEAFKKYFSERNKLQIELEKHESKIIRKDEELRGVEHKNTAIALELAKYDAEVMALEQEFKQYGGVTLLTRVDRDELKKEAWSVDQKLSRIGNVNMKALEVYDRVQEEFDRLVVKKEVLHTEREKILVMINEIDTKKKELFLKVFDVINTNFQKIFKILSTKGQAEMELEDKHDPFAGGVSIKVRLKGPKFMDIRSLSGGEKTLTALAFIFAVQEHNPAPFYIFDEVDAALDKRNSEKLAGLIKSYSDRAQYIVVSHNDGVISQADTLYGVSMNEHGISKVVSLKL